MIFYLLYLIGRSLAISLPRRAVYVMADSIAYLYWLFSKRDRAAIENNMRVVVTEESERRDIGRLSIVVFRNFARYLVDFFRFSKLDRAFIEKFVKVEGEGFLKEAQSSGKGVVLLSAHLGNWEMGGAILSLIGYPVYAVALTHSNRAINDFFLRQRAFGKVNVISSIGPELKRCFSVLKSNGFIALLGDRDFSGKGAVIDFFGRPARLPVGPAVYSLRTGAAILPVFVICEGDLTFRLIIEEPIYPSGFSSADSADKIKNLMSRYLTIIEDYIKRYPAQWLMFREVWNDGPNSGPDTII